MRANQNKFSVLIAVIIAAAILAPVASAEQRVGGVPLSSGIRAEQGTSPFASA